MKLPSALERLIQELQKLPGIGRKSSERIAFYLINSNTADANALAQAILQVKQKVHLCPQCFNITDKELCAICSSSDRDRSQLCIVEQVVDLIALEKSGAYKGLYHVLRGRLAPLEGITDAELTIRELELRLRNNPEIKEIIIATTTGLEGEATATYLTQRLKPFDRKISRIGLGLPASCSFEYADEITLRKALESRRPI